MKTMLRWVAVACAVVGVGGAGVAVGSVLRQDAPPQITLVQEKTNTGLRIGAEETEAPIPVSLGSEEVKTVSLFKNASPSVVNITRLEVSSMSFNESAIPTGTGSGFVWDDQGHIVTNYHVIQGASSARVTLDDRVTYEAELVGASADKDIAVLKIKAPSAGLKPLGVGSSEGLLVGQQVYAIGNPFGLDHTLSTGVISGVAREIKSVAGRPITGVIQTDAAINPGNSGGPLLDSSGRLIGMNTAIYSPSGASAGIGFAVPVDTIKRIVPQLIEHGKVVKPGLGIEIKDRVRGVKGVLVMNVIAGSGAEAAGLVPTRRGDDGRIELGDAIVSIDGKPVADSADLFRALDTHEVGDTVTLEVSRDGQTRKVTVTLKELEG
jgi:S1-C subfamily serine protease